MSDFPPVFFAALSDPTRLRALVLLAMRGEMCVCQLVAAIGVSQPKMSRHLAALRDAGIVRDRRKGQWVHYRLNESLPDWAAATLATAAAALAGTEPHCHDLARAGKPEGMVA
ncbi:MAG: metalloregulator ArsR/SmtB family transcription factor [Magnetospirillum sp.]|nr:metalloregulator ArsR/SmtB family transcription factor [Magnetospirillum sp.]